MAQEGGELIAPHGLRTAAREATEMLREQTGLPIWVVARVHRGELETVHELGAEGTVPLAVSVSGRMLEGVGPRVAPRVADVPVYADFSHAGLGAFLGAPITREDGFVFGTLSGFDPEERAELERHLPLVELAAAMLGRVWSAGLEAHAADERAAEAEAEARRDAVTGVASRRSWDELLEAEEVRCRRYGHPASVLLADLDGLKRVNDEQGHAAGDRLLRTAAEAIASATRSGDVVARIGGDEFGILAMETDERAASALAARVRQALDTAGVEASVGLGTREKSGTLQDAFASADAAMYEKKRRRGR